MISSMLERHPKASRMANCLLLSAACLLAACTAAGPAPRGVVIEDLDRGDAQQAYDRGEFREAARTWQQEAIDADPPAASQLRLHAADAWLRAGNAKEAGDLLPWVDEGLLSQPDDALLNLLRAELALGENRPLEARRHLTQVGGTLSEAYASRYVEISRETETALGNLNAQSIYQVGQAAEDIRGYDPLAALDLMRQLEQIPSGQLAYLSTLDGDPKRAAWFDLALVIRNNLVSGEDLEPAIHEWKRRHPDSELSIGDALDLWLRYRQEFAPPGRVAVLIPDSGRLKTAGAAIRDGFMTAYMARPQGAEVRFYGTEGTEESVLAAYFEAADDGAEWIIGPVEKESVEALLGLAGLATPVLALNDLPADSAFPPGLEQQVFGMSLSQDSEAASVAQHMAELGYRRVAVLAPENPWGERIVQAFESNFLQQNRKILVAARYLPGENDHSQVLERILRIDESKARMEQLQNRLGLELEFEPVRRNDIDAIFLAADPEQGRLLGPQLRFFDAGDIPTFATSRVYTGVPDPARNRDLNGLNVPLTTWQVNHPSRSSIPDVTSLRGGAFAPLFAIGIDAWNILPFLDLMRVDPDFSFPGQTGTYSMPDGTNLRRTPQWARFEDGLPIRADSPTGTPEFADRGR